jgi:hypothetical protein
MSVTPTLSVRPGVGRRVGRLNKGLGWSSRSTEESVVSGSDHRDLLGKQVTP